MSSAPVKQKTKKQLIAPLRGWGVYVPC